MRNLEPKFSWCLRWHTKCWPHLPSDVPVFSPPLSNVLTHSNLRLSTFSPCFPLPFPILRVEWKQAGRQRGPLASISLLPGATASLGQLLAQDRPLPSIKISAEAYLHRETHSAIPEKVLTLESLHCKPDNERTKCRISKGVLRCQM